MLTREEAQRLRRVFVNTLWALHDMQVYWRPVERRLVARKVNAQVLLPIPPDCVLVGRYARPVPSRYFMGDLIDLIAKLDRSPAARA
jgi:hypothetical protein